jgi:hypothetical protein
MEEEVKEENHSNARPSKKRTLQEITQENGETGENRVSKSDLKRKAPRNQLSSGVNVFFHQPSLQGSEDHISNPEATIYEKRPYEKQLKQCDQAMMIQLAEKQSQNQRFYEEQGRAHGQVVFSTQRTNSLLMNTNANQ